MHAIELVDVAGVLCLGARNLLEDCPHVSQSAILDYWTAARCRLDVWGRDLREFGRPGADVTSEAFVSLAEEILLSQAHTRPLTALCVLHDSRWNTADETAAVARNILAGHDEALSRLKPLWSRSIDKRHGLHLNVVAGRAKRWSDMLLGYLLPSAGSPGVRSPEGHVIEFAFEPQRVVEFAFDADAHSGRSLLDAQRLLSASLRMTLSGNYSPAANPDINRRIAGATFGLFGPEAFDEFGLLRSTWVRRIERSADETLGMLDGLFEEKPPQPVPKRF